MRSVVVVVGLAILCAAGAALEAGSSSRPDLALFRIRAARLDHAPEIDGRFDNPLWDQAVKIDSFTQYEPQEGAPPSERTVAWIGYDRDKLYIAVRCYDSNPKAIRACLTQRDKVQGDDEVSIYLDTFNDLKRAFVFQVNPCGIQSDGVYTEPSGRHRGGGRGGGGSFDRVDRNWDTYFYAAATMDEEGYFVELAIPFKSLRFPNTPDQVWGLQIMRSIRRKNEEVYWRPRSRAVNGFLVQMGKLEIPGDIVKGRNLEVMPVFTGLGTKADRFHPQAGLNVKYGITSDLTMDAALNPDFSQIEADIPQIDVNQRYDLYFPEKRPFFLEGKDFFDGPLELLYTRKLVEPQWGLKLSGKAGRTTLGFLSVLDDRPAHIEIPGVDPEIEVPAGSRGLFSVARLKRDLFAESHVGFILTDKEMGPSFDGVFTDYNRVAGVDGQFKFLDTNRIAFQIAGSKSRAAGRTTDFVPAAILNLSHQGRHLQASADWTGIHPDFEAAAGFFRRKDVRSFNSRVGYAFLPMTEYVVSVTPAVTYRRAYDWSGALTDEDREIQLSVSGWGQSLAFLTYENSYEKYQGLGFDTWQLRLMAFSEPLSWLSGMVSRSFGDGIYYDANPYLGFKTAWGTRLTFKPRPNLQVAYNVQNNEFFKGRGGEKVYAVNLVSQRLTYQLSKPLSLRWITDYNDYNRQLFLSVLFSYQLNPGTVFYLGLDDSRGDVEGIFRNTGRSFFVKFSYWWRT